MRSKRILEGSSVVLGVFVVFITQTTSFSIYTTYLLAILIVFYIIYITLKKRSKTAFQLFSGNPFELFLLISIITFIIGLTNGLTSPLFFLVFFTLFGLAFMSDPIVVLIYAGSIILYFIPELLGDFSQDLFIRFGSILLLTPIAYFVGRELERRQILGRRIEEKTSEIIDNVKALKDDGTERSSDEDDELDEITEEAESLKEDNNS